jgi:hypothetical protein
MQLMFISYFREPLTHNQVPVDYGQIQFLGQQFSDFFTQASGLSGNSNKQQMNFTSGAIR